MFTVIFYSKLLNFAVEKPFDTLEEAKLFSLSVGGRIKELYQYGY